MPDSRPDAATLTLGVRARFAAARRGFARFAFAFTFATIRRFATFIFFLAAVRRGRLFIFAIHSSAIRFVSHFDRREWRDRRGHRSDTLSYESNA